MSVIIRFVMLNFPLSDSKILASNANQDQIVPLLQLQNDSKVAIVGNEWAGSFLRALLHSCPRSYIVDKKFLLDSSCVLAVGEISEILKAQAIARRLKRSLFVVLTSPLPPPCVAPFPKIIISFRNAFSLQSDKTADAFGELAAFAFSVADRYAASIIFDSHYDINLFKKAKAVLDDAIIALESCSADKKIKTDIVSDAALKIYALKAALGDNDPLAACSLLKPFGNPDSGQKKFLLAITLTRLCLAHFCDPSADFVPPPYLNDSIDKFARLSGLCPLDFGDAFKQNFADSARVRPRLAEFSDDITHVLQLTDQFNLRALRILKRLRFDCGVGLRSLLSPRDALDSKDVLRCLKEETILREV